MEENKNLEPANENLSDDEILDFGSEYAEAEIEINEEIKEEVAEESTEPVWESIEDEPCPEEFTAEETPSEPVQNPQPTAYRQPPYTPPAGAFRQPPYQPPQQTYPYPPYQPPQQNGYIPPNTPYNQPSAPPSQAYPQGYNQPYNPQPYGYAPQPQTPAPKKKSTGAKVMLICLWVLLGIFSLAIIGICGYYMGIRDISLDFRPGYEDDNRYDDYTSPKIPDKNDETTSPSTEETEPDKYPVTSNPDSNEDKEPVNSEIFDKNSKITLNNYPADKSDRNKYTTQYAYEKISPSTVGIMCYSKTMSNQLEGQGTGIIVTSTGYIATNSHVIGDTKSSYRIEVILNDGNTYTATVVGFDTRTDLAVLKIEASGLVPAEFADSDLVSIGEDVIAVGNPGGMEFQNTLTRGVISAKDRTLDLSTQVKYIQTDAAINPGNSGGPLCNACGQVIGINSAKIADADYEGMGFAIPSRTVKDVVDDLIMQGFVSGRVKIGIIGTAITDFEAQYNKVPRGILISEIVEGGPCDNGKIRTDDILCKLDDYDIKSFNDIFTALTNYKKGDEVVLKLYRPSSEDYYEVRVTLQADDGSTTAE
ncbi:MAG: trypsin-like serine protease [Ruminococcaceae bacterium]|nr:trypsin-like serine protease [Oscillospiraceae bacterium]